MLTGPAEAQEELASQIHFRRTKLFFFFLTVLAFSLFSVGILCYRMLKTCFVAQMYGLNLWSLLKLTSTTCLPGGKRLDRSCVPLALVIGSFLLPWAKGRALSTCHLCSRRQGQGTGMSTVFHALHSSS